MVCVRKRTWRVSIPDTFHRRSCCSGRRSGRFRRQPRGLRWRCCRKPRCACCGRSIRAGDPGWGLTHLARPNGFRRRNRAGRVFGAVSQSDATITSTDARNFVRQKKRRRMAFLLAGAYASSMHQLAWRRIRETAALLPRDRCLSSDFGEPICPVCSMHCFADNA